MILAVTERQSHCTSSGCRLKCAILLSVASAAALAFAEQMPPGDRALRVELTLLVESGQTERAIERAQTALREAPDDPAVRDEYTALHLALARTWLSQQRFDDCLAAVAAILAIQPDHEPALSIRRQIVTARERAGGQTSDIDRLLRLELFEGALDRIQEIKALRPDLAESLAARERATWLGAADDHYLARNFPEAFALYEHRLSLGADLPPEVLLRWALSLGLTLSAGDSNEQVDAGAVRRLRARLSEILPRIEQPLTAQAVSALLTERAGQRLAAGRAYAEALGIAWPLPPADQRRAAVADLRRQVVDRLRSPYDADRGRRREGIWQIVLPDVWKHRQTEHFDVYARNDLVTERVAEAAEFHFAGLGQWLGLACADRWEPRCELRIHATLEALHRATNTTGITRALTRTRVQGDRVLLRRMNLFQSDPWLLSSTLPHELTHMMLADVCRNGKLPLAIDEGLALQAEPPARRLQFRRLLGTSAPNPTDLLGATRIPADQLTFYACCEALTSLLLRQADVAATDTRDPEPIAALVRTFRDGYAPDWWETLGWESERAMREDWAAWHEARRCPPRMPLMILAQPPAKDHGDDS